MTYISLRKIKLIGIFLFWTSEKEPFARGVFYTKLYIDKQKKHLRIYKSLNAFWKEKQIVAYSACNQAFLANNSSSVSSLSSSTIQQSTGQTEAHCGSSWNPLHSVHLSVTIK